LDKRSGSPVTTWVELLVLEALVGQTLWKLKNSCGISY